MSQKLRPLELPQDRSDLRIGLDGRPMQGRRTGIGRYVFELCRALDLTLPDAKFYVYSQFPVEMPGNPDRWISRIDPKANRIKHIAWLKLRCGSMCKQDNLDLFWATATMFPPLAPRVRRISTVYDLNHKVVPETMPVATLWAYCLFFKRDVMGADCITTISQGSSDKLREHLGRAADLIVHPAVGSEFAPASVSQMEEVRKRYAVHVPYLLAVATLEPRKNLNLLIDVFMSLKEAGDLPANYELLLVGGKGWKDSSLTRKIEYSASYGVRPLGFVPDKDLPPLYSASEAFLFPSIYEGFGMPVLEARACGTRTLSSDIPELREAGGTAISSCYCEPTLAGLRQGILSVLGVPHPIVRGPDLQTWQKAAELFSSAIVGQIDRRPFQATSESSDAVHVH